GSASGYPWKISGAAKVKKLEDNGIFGDYCELESQKLVKQDQIKPKLRNAGEIQMAQLPVLKTVRPWYGEIDSTVLQENIKRLDKAYQKFFTGAGFPNFKNRSTFRSFTYTLGVKIEENQIYLPKIGWVSFFNSRPVPLGFKIKSCTLRKKANGWFVSVRIEDPTVPAFPVIKVEEANTAVGGDMGIKKLITFSDGSVIKNPKLSTNKKTRRLMRIRQREINRKKKGSKNRKKASNRVARLHQRIVNKRTAIQWKIAIEISKKYDAIFLEDLKVSNMKKRCKPKKDEQTGRYINNGQSKKVGLNRAISDAGWYELRSKIEYAAAKSGKIFGVVPPYQTSQECPQCHHIDASNRDGEKFLCGECGYSADADQTGAVNIKNRGVEKFGIALKCQVKVKKVRVDCSEPRQLLLFETPSPELTGFYGQNDGSTRKRRKRHQPGNLPLQLSLELWG
ncbi:MAG: transposase, partial [Stigonema ocellatum SAG 48.90 = DSM 106950]|nr:transposase [Stigonema ocellatum SAG 48.90 = DSM 106950]